MRKYLCADCAASLSPRSAHECPGCRSLKAKDWYQKNKTKVREWTQGWREKNPEKWAKIKAAWTRKNPEAHRKTTARWQQRNPDKHYQRQVRYRKNNREKHLADRKKEYSRIIYGEFGLAHRALLDLRREIRGIHGG